jgi:tetratricopeptide (TPR) repeat protein
MADKQTSKPEVITTTTIEEINPTLEKAKGFWAKFSKPIIYVGTAAIVLIGGWLAYKNFYKLPNEQKASDMVFAAEKLFGKMATSSSYNKDTVGIVLNGGNIDGTTVSGLLKVISNYGSTPAANRAQLMVGACYLHIKEFDKAIKHLKEFNANGATQVESSADMMLGHAYAEQKKNDDALSYYKKAASASEKDEPIAVNALMTAANFAEQTGKNKDAIELYQQIKTKFPASQQVSSGELDKYLARLGIVK